MYVGGGVHGAFPSDASAERYEQFTNTSEAQPFEREFDLVHELGTRVVSSLEMPILPPCDVVDVRYHAMQIRMFRNDQDPDRLEKAINEETDYFRRHSMTPDAANVFLLRFRRADRRRQPLLTAGEEVALAKTIEMGKETEDEDIVKKATDRFTLSNTGLVRDIAWHISEASGADFESLVQEGFLGVNHAIQKFDWRREIKFSTYATWWVKQYMHRSITNKERLIHIPSNVAAAAKGAVKLEEDMRQFGLAGEELEEYIASEEDNRVNNLGFNIYSLDTPIGEGSTTVIDMISDPKEDTEAEAIGNFDVDELRNALEVLPDDVRHLIIARHELYGGEKIKMKVLSEKFGLSEYEIRKALRDGMERLQVRYGRLDETTADRIYREREEKRQAKIEIALLRDPDLASAFDTLTESQRLAVILRRGLDGGGQRTYKQIGIALAELEGRDAPYTYEAARYVLFIADNTIREVKGEALKAFNDGGEIPQTELEKRAENEASAAKLRSQFPKLDEAFVLMNDKQRFVINLHAGLDGGGQRSKAEIARQLTKHTGRPKTFHPGYIGMLINQAENIIREVHELPLEPYRPSDPIPQSMAERNKEINLLNAQKLEEYKSQFPNLDEAMLEISEEQRIALTLKRGLDGNGELSYLKVADHMNRLLKPEKPYTWEYVRKIIHRAENIIRQHHGLEPIAMKQGKRKSAIV